MEPSSKKCLSSACFLAVPGLNELIIEPTHEQLGKNFEKVCEACHITLNKTPIFGDNGAISPAGVRIGTPAMTTRGCLEEDFEMIVEFLLRAAQIASNVQREHGKLQKEFLKGLQCNRDVIDLRDHVEAFASQFALPGFDI